METKQRKLSWLGLFPIMTGIAIMIVNTMLILRNPPYQFVYLLIVMLMVCSIGAYYLTGFKQLKVFGHIGMLIFLLGGGILFLNNFVSWAFDIAQIVSGKIVIYIISTGYLLLGIDAWLIRPPYKVAGLAYLLLVSVPILAFLRFQLGIQGLAIQFFPSYVEGLGWGFLGFSLLLGDRAFMKSTQRTCPACKHAVALRDAYCPHCGNSLIV